MKNVTTFMVLFLLLSSPRIFALDNAEVVSESDPALNNVVSLVMENNRSTVESPRGLKSNTICTGIALSKRIVLTAGHCVMTASAAYVFQGVRVPVIVYSQYEKRVDLSQGIRVEAKFFGGRVPGTEMSADTAILYLQRDLQLPLLPVTFPKTTKLTELYSKKLMFYGFGHANTSETETPKPILYNGAGVLRKKEIEIFVAQQENQFLAIKRILVDEKSTANAPDIEVSETPDEDLAKFSSGTRTGDSGGPAFLVEDGKIVLYMNLSFTSMLKTFKPGIDVFTYLPPFKSGFVAASKLWTPNSVLEF